VERVRLLLAPPEPIKKRGRPPEGVSPRRANAAPPMSAPPPKPPAARIGLRESMERIGHLVSRGVLVALYALLFAPVGIAYRLFADPLGIRRPHNSNWQPWPSRNDSIERARRQE